jgi:hypothetical protein
MNDSELRALLNRAREFEHKVGTVTFRCRVPTMQQAQRIYARYDGPARWVEGMQDIISESLLSISGATARDLGLDSDEPLPETVDAARMYLSEHIGAADSLADELKRRADERNAKIEGDAKN